MRTLDFAPLYRSTVGFERMANMLDRAMATGENQNGYPPYNIEKAGDDNYRITVAVSGFSDDELSVETRDGQLVISGKKAESKTNGDANFLHRGIANRAFERRFQLADHIRAVGASTENGLLHVDVVREIPEALKPRRIEIGSAVETITATKRQKKAS